MKKLSGFITKQQAKSLIDNHKGYRACKILKFGDKKNDYINLHHCILWGDWFEETDAYGSKSNNRIVVDEFRWEERTPDWILEMNKRYDLK